MNSFNKAKNSFLYKTMIPNIILKKVNQDKIQEKVKEDNEIDGRNSTSPGDASPRLKPNSELKDQSRKDVSILKSRTKNKSNQGPTYEQCFSGSTFPPQYEEECPVNYSLKYSETELSKAPPKTESPKVKFKDFADYAETDLDQPTNFSLKYAENTCSDEETKTLGFNYYGDKQKFKRYPDYAETDLDQPTDFTLKYRESTEDDVKSPEFGYSGSNNNKTKVYGGQTESEETSNDRGVEHYACANETPLMFSRCSSLNSLSSFVHITQSIPDDRSSVVSDFSRMTSGIISPSELPDSPTQTAPSSPKRLKAPVCFTAKSDFAPKKSVFEDDVATYKQEDTPVEFSRATSLSSLNIENTSKSEFNPKENSASKEECTNFTDQSLPDSSKEQILPEKVVHEKIKTELSSVTEVDESLIADCIKAGIQENSSRKPRQNCSPILQKTVNTFIAPVQRVPSRQVRQPPEFVLKPNLRQKLPKEAEKVFSTFEVPEDVVHTYCTEGTPANISHAGSHSDLSALSMVSGMAPSGVDEDSDRGSYCSDTHDGLETKEKPLENEILNRGSSELNLNKPLPATIKKVNIVPNVFLGTQPQFDYLQKDSQLMAKDETATFAIENSPCNFSIRSSFSDLTVSVADSPLCLNRPEVCEEPPSEAISPMHNVSPQSPSSITLEDPENVEKLNEEEKLSDEKEDNYWADKDVSGDDANCEIDNNDEDDDDDDDDNVKNYAEETAEYSEATPLVDSSRVANFDLYSSEPLTPFEEALLEQCIRLGMPQKKENGVSDGNSEKDVGSNKSSEASKSVNEKTKSWNTKSTQHDTRTVSHLDVRKGENVENFDFDSSEPLTLFEEALIEQCIRLGMPQKKSVKKVEKENFNSSNQGVGNEIDSTEHITPFEAALLEQCIRLGMPQRRNQKKIEENSKSFASCDDPNKLISCVSAQLNKLKINTESEKESKKGGDHVGCNCGRRHVGSTNSRRKNSNCKRSKKCKE